FDDNIFRPFLLFLKVIKDEDLKAYKERTRKDKGVFASDVRIHYRTMEHRIYRHSPEFTTETLFSYLGGITGGWLGISLLEFCAFLEGVFSVLIFSLKSCSKPKKKKKKTPPVPKVSSVCRKPEKLEGILLGLPIVRSGKTIRVVPYQYY
ncbi:uncharacterized protein LOC118205440, partial [Stegodyphus dumicola]|uniref:uncharacterized protein LOC118205440 n=1 Tax=Stegodyphus dumicola TaxID=202533 RepID=UPI0015AF22BA